MKKIVFACMIGVCLLCTACQPKINGVSQNVTTKEDSQSEDKNREDSKENSEDDSSNTKASNSAKEEGSKAGSDSNEVTDTKAEERALTKSELQTFSTMLQGMDDYGFLMSEYTKPEEIDLEQLFYSYAGIATETPSDTERAAYLKASGQDEIYCDLGKLTTEEINTYLKEKTGLTLNDMTQKLDWTYMPEYDAYYGEHGDTNYTAFTCASGKQVGDTLILECSAGEENWQNCELTLKKTGDSYQFVSNKFVDKIDNAKATWLIDDQTYDVTLDGWGNVTFASYLPSGSIYLNDVSFGLLDGTTTLFTFPDFDYDESRYNRNFKEIKTVSFKDYDGDGKTDVLIICTYTGTGDTNKGKEITEARLYKQPTKEKTFLLDTDLTNYLNKNNYNTSIDVVMAHVHDK